MRTKLKNWDWVGPKLSTNKVNKKMLMRWQECHEADVLSSVDCRWLLITVFSDARLQTALSPSLLDYLTDEVYLILQNKTQKGKTEILPCFMHSDVQKNTYKPNSTLWLRTSHLLKTRPGILDQVAISSGKLAQFCSKWEKSNARPSKEVWEVWPHIA